MVTTISRKKIIPKEIIFEDYPEFKPNLTPSQIFQLGSFGGTYWRPIISNISSKPMKLKNMHLQYPSSWWENLDESVYLTSTDYNININKYQVVVGTSLQFWEKNRWISPHNRYGWVHWYCDFYLGKRNKKEDQRQIKRWLGIAGENGRFKKWLIKLIKDRNTKYNDMTVSPKIRQTLQHWGYQLTLADFKKSF